MKDIMNTNIENSKDAVDEREDENKKKTTTQTVKHEKVDKRRAEFGCLIRVKPEMLLSKEEVELINCEYIYGILGKASNILENKENKEFDVKYAPTDSPEVDRTLSSFTTISDNIFDDIMFGEDEESDEFGENKRYVVKVMGKWQMVVEGGGECNYCHTNQCDRMKYSRELDEMVQEANDYDNLNNEKRFTTYRSFSYMKWGRMGTGNRRKLCDCVQKFILEHFPVDKGKRKRGFQAR